MILNIVIIIAVLIALFALIVAMRPGGFTVARATNIDAPPSAVFAQVNDLHNWEAWSPWAKLDPNARTSYDGPQAGVGASFAWSGNAKIGEGRMTITESRPDELIRIRLDFVKPFKGTNDAEFTFAPEGNQTRVKWSMSGKLNFVTKAIGLFMNCEKMIGPQFEKGLEQLKSAVANSAVRA